MPQGGEERKGELQQKNKQMKKESTFSTPSPKNYVHIILIGNKT